MDEPTRPYLITQTCKLNPVPAGGADVDERERLRAALTWSYEYDLLIYEPQPFEGSVRCATPGADGLVPHTQFKVVEDLLGIERTALMSRTGGGLSMEEVELIPLADYKNEHAFKLLEATREQRCIRYAGDPWGGRGGWRLRVNGLDMLRNPKAVGSVSAGGSGPVGFNEPVYASTSVEDEFRIDRLFPAEGGRRELRAYLQDLLGLFYDGVQPSSVKLSCEYAQRLAGLDVEVKTKVLLTVLGAGDAPVDPKEVSAALASEMNAWRESVRPDGGEFIIALQLLQQPEAAALPWVSFNRLVLPGESIEGF
jgi:hypothetical protein